MVCTKRLAERADRGVRVGPSRARYQSRSGVRVDADPGRCTVTVIVFPAASDCSATSKTNRTDNSDLIVHCGTARAAATQPARHRYPSNHDG